MAQDTPEDKNLTDKAKDAATTAKEKVSDFATQHQDKIDKAKEVAVTAKEKVSDFVGQHEDKIGSAIDKAGEFVDEKVTKKRFTGQIGKAQDVAKGAVSKIAGSDDDEPGDKAPPTE
jgi:antitoxin protein of toxin-antitoxin system